MQLTALLPLSRNASCGFSLPLNIIYLRSGLDPRTLGPLASTVAVTPLGATLYDHKTRIQSYER
jgi:hypothetical protein